MEITQGSAISLSLSHRHHALHFIVSFYIYFHFHQHINNVILHLRPLETCNLLILVQSLYCCFHFHSFPRKGTCSSSPGPPRRPFIAPPGNVSQVSYRNGGRGGGQTYDNAVVGEPRARRSKSGAPAGSGKVGDTLGWPKRPLLN